MIFLSDKEIYKINCPMTTVGFLEIFEDFPEISCGKTWHLIL